MKRWMFIIGLLLLVLAWNAFSAPFLIGDVADGVTNCRIFLDGTEVGTVTAGQNTCRYDVAGVSNGNHRAEMTAIGNDPIWGGAESAKSAPFDFVRPAPPTVPASLRLAP